MNNHTQLPGTYHYELIRRAIEIIDAAETPLSLDALALQLKMSPAHFQRLFSQWAGVSPKKYQQYLSLNYAKQLLQQQRSVLDVAHGAGLSGSGRLHDLFVRWEAMSPGEYARGGEGLVIRWGWFESPFGEALIMGTERGICALGFAVQSGAKETFADLAQRWPQAHFQEDQAFLQGWAQSVFQRQGVEKTPLYLMGAPFQIKVWEALLQIREGQVASYSQIAEAIGAPRAVRAVGTAVGRNPISLLIPCHRALRKSGAMGGYHWGLPVKRAMLAYEAARTEER